jgi:hypothetical protein
MRSEAKMKKEEMKKEKRPVNGNVEPYNKRNVANSKKAFASTEKSVKPVAKDTNKTRRKMVKPTAMGVKIPKAPSPLQPKNKRK